MIADNTGKIYIFGGQTLVFFLPQQIKTVEMLNTANCTLRELGPLKFGMLKRQFSLDLQKEHKVLLCGGEKADQHNILQVYDCSRGTTVNTIELPIAMGGHAYGGALIKDHVIVVMKFRTIVLSMKDILCGSNENVKICDNYIIPNKACAVVKGLDGQSIILLGGKPKGGKPKCYAYQANVDEILDDTLLGWQPASIPWSLGECMFVGGYSIANIPVPSSCA